MQPFANEYNIAAPLDSPAGNRIERRRMQRFTRANVETGVMPGAAYGLTGHQALRERAVVVSAIRSNGEEFATPAQQHDVVAIDAPHELAAVRQGGRRHTVLEVGSGFVLRFHYSQAFRSAN